MDGKFYVTTPIYYVNAEPHLGHAYTTILADVLRRFHHLMGHETFFVTGTDEHGDKVLQAARDHDMDPKQYVDKVSRSFKELWPRLHCEPDRFIRTTDPEHVAVVQAILQRVYEKGDIYFGRYEGLYCTGCERFYTEKELEGGLCPQHRVVPERREEENYFFRMSRYQEWLRGHILENPEFIRPERYRNEALSMLREPLEDLCISRPRARLDWGIPLPFDQRFVTYVWFDALINYVSALGYPDHERFSRLWPHAQHLIAKDILKPHGIYWPTMLKAAGIEPYSHLNVHGYWNVDASKMSKSLGNVVRPLDLVEKYGVDPFRYFLIREMTFGLDANFSETALVQRLNADLANDLGNLLQRTLTMARRYCEGKVPPAHPGESLDEEVRVKAGEMVDNYKREMARLGTHRALMGVWELIGLANRYIDRTEPFRLAKDPSRRQRLENVLYHALEVNRLLSLVLWPVMPSSASEMSRQLGLRAPGERGELLEKGKWGFLEPGAPLGPHKALFPRVEVGRAEVVMEKPAQGGSSGPSAPQGKAQEEAPSREITIEDFREVELRVAKVVEAKRVKGSERLLHLVVDLGGETRTLVAGIASNYNPEQIQGRSIVVVANLKPARVFGQISQGMLLAAVGESGPRLVTVDGEVAPGTRVS
jgi:methionyl-tRNA synthetase